MVVGNICIIWVYCVYWVKKLIVERIGCGFFFFFIFVMDIFVYSKYVYWIILSMVISREESCKYVKF